MFFFFFFKKKNCQKCIEKKLFCPTFLNNGSTNDQAPMFLLVNQFVNLNAAFHHNEYLQKVTHIIESSKSTFSIFCISIRKGLGKEIGFSCKSVTFHIEKLDPLHPKWQGSKDRGNFVSFPL